MADSTTPAAPLIDIATVEADAEKLNKLWATAQVQYQARKDALAARVDAYVAAHQTQIDAHSAEIAAAALVKNKIVPAVAGVETALADVEQFVFSSTWYTKLKAWVQKNHRPLVWLVGVSALGGIYWLA